MGGDKVCVERATQHWGLIEGLTVRRLYTPRLPGHCARHCLLCIAGAAMECGSQEVLCHVLTWVTENELAARKFNDLVIKLSEGTTGGIAVVGAFLAAHGQLLIGLVGATFGFWRYWRYRERILHKRLAEYIGTRDSRLREVRVEVLGAVQRPAPGHAGKAPLFVDKELRSVLRENRWGNAALAFSIESSAKWQLSKAIDSIARKLETAERQVSSLRLELSTAYSLKGALASSGTLRDNDREALALFRNALSYSDQRDDVQLRELEAHQLRRIGEYRQARKAYARLIRLSRSMISGREQFLIEARARRYLAELEPARKNAYSMMIAPLEGRRFSPGPLALIDECTLLNECELVEKADMYYFTAFLAHSLSFPQAPSVYLNGAKDAYQEALSKLVEIDGGSKSKLRGLIAAGLRRISLAQTEKKFDVDWLPKLHQLQQVSAKVGSTSGN